MKTTFIYALTCPTTGQIRYVGKSNSPAKRLKAHLGAQETCYRTNWLRSLKNLGLTPGLEIIDEVPESEWQQWEVAYIEYFREQGCDLVNGNLGGEGGHRPSEETRAKMRVHMMGKNNPQFGKPLTPAHRANVSAALKGRKVSPEARAKIGAAHRGKKVSKETRAKISAAHLGQVSWNKGKKLSPETCAKISASLTGKKPSAEARANQSAAQRGRKPSVETRAKQRVSKLGDKNPNFGKKFSPEHCARMRIAHSGEKNHNFGKTGEKSFWFGKTHSPETLAKMSDSARSRGNCNRLVEGEFLPEHRAKISAGLRLRKIQKEISYVS